LIVIVLGDRFGLFWRRRKSCRPYVLEIGLVGLVMHRVASKFHVEVKDRADAIAALSRRRLEARVVTPRNPFGFPHKCSDGPLLNVFDVRGLFRLKLRHLHPFGKTLASNNAGWLRVFRELSLPLGYLPLATSHQNGIPADVGARKRK
jgi:hypothetical protein